MTARPPIKGVVFDKDGTLFDFAATWESWAQGLLQSLATGPAHHRALADAVDFDLASGGFRPGSVVIAGTATQVAEALAVHLPDQPLPALLDFLNEEAARAPQREAVPLAPLLQTLRGAGLRLGVATNDAEGPARAHLSAAEVLPEFDFVAGCDSGFGGKPAPGQLHAFCKALDLAPEACVMVGDSLHDLHAGRAAGFATVGVLTGYASAETLAPMADVVLPDIGGLPDWLAAR